MASRPLPRISGPWVNAAVTYSRSASTPAVCSVWAALVQKESTGQVRRERMFQIASPVISVPVASWSSEQCPGV
jgi:hypothetical protein